MKTYLHEIALAAVVVASLAASAVSGRAADSPVPGAPPTKSDRGSSAEAQALVARAIAAYKAHGSAAFVEMTAPSAKFVDRDLYVFVFRAGDGVTVAHGAEASRVGQAVTDLVDAEGKRFGAEFIARATADGAWVDYRWTDPLTGDGARKSSWVVRHDGYVFGAGVYKRGPE